MAQAGMVYKMVVQAEGLTKTFKDFWRRPKVHAVRGVNFNAASGEILGLLGPNGSGKSTILKMILGLLVPSAGRLRVFGQSPRHVPSKERIGYLPEESYLYPYLTAEEIIAFYARLFNLSSAERRVRVDQLLDMVGLNLARRRQVGEFSKGMLRRVGLAQALINDPDLIVLDEPTAGLDPEGCRQVKDLILALARRQKTIILSSHLLADMEDICDRIAILYNGSIVIQGAVQNLLEQHESYRLELSDLAPDVLAKALTVLQREIGRAVTLDHPRRTLEAFFLEAVEQASQQAPEQTGVMQSSGLAGYLFRDPSGKTDKHDCCQ